MKKENLVCVSEWHIRIKIKNILQISLWLLKNKIYELSLDNKNIFSTKQPVALKNSLWLGGKFMKTAVYILDTKVLEDKEIFASQYAKMMDYRKKRIDSYKDDNDKRLCLGTGILLSYALEKAGENEKELEYAKKESGMPYFKNKSDFYFSLSHSGERAMCAVSKNSIGCDVELLDDSNKDTVGWTKIESYAKATDTPLAYLMGNKGSMDSAYKFCGFERGDGYVYTVCSKEAITDEVLEIVSL